MAPPSVEEVFARAESYFEREILAVLLSGQTRGMTLSAVEAFLRERMQQLMRQVLEEYLADLGPGRVPEGTVTGEDGVKRGEARQHERHLETIFGTVAYSRLGYGAEGVESRHPKDAALNLAREAFSHTVRREMAEEAAKGSFEDAVATLERTTGARIAKRQAEELVARAAQDFDTFYEWRRERQRREDGSTAPIVVLTTDGKGIVMRRDDLREATRRAAESRQHKLTTRLSKGEKRNAKRMATVAAVYNIDRFVRTPEEVLAPKGPLREVVDQRRPRPEGKRVWASVTKAPEEVIDEMFLEGRSRDPEGRATWVALVDGAKPQLRHLKERAAAHGVELTIVLDVFHVAEYVWKAGLAFHDEGTPDLEIWVRDRLFQILRGKGRLVAAALRREATKAKLAAPPRDAVDDCAAYLTDYAEHLHYDEYLAQGLPIGTGVIEGACRHLVKDRMDVTGARWSLRGAEAVLRLRALRASGDFDEYWPFHEQRDWHRNHASLYAGGKPPRPIDERRPSVRPTLRLVK